MVLILMGVSGSGKTTVGKALASSLGWTFVEADDFHPAANIEKMRNGIALNDDDRWPWLRALRQRIDEACASDENVVMACSALKQVHRDELDGGSPGCVRFIFLTGSEELIRERLEEREGHFMDPDLIHSQFEALEPPEGVIWVDVAPAPETIAANIRQQLVG
jgi:gluconokinase